MSELEELTKLFTNQNSTIDVLEKELDTLSSLNVENANAQLVKKLSNENEILKAEIEALQHNLDNIKLVSNETPSSIFFYCIKITILNNFKEIKIQPTH